MATLNRRTDLAPDARPVPDGRRRAATELVRCASLAADSGWCLTPIGCVRRPRGSRCRGAVEVRCSGEAVDWRCTGCPDHGTIVGWAGTDADMRATARALRSPSATLLLTREEYEELRRATHREPALHAMTHGARPRRTGEVDADVHDPAEVVEALRRCSTSVRSQAARGRLTAIADRIDPDAPSSPGVGRGSTRGRTAQLRIALRETSPPVWRRVLVPADLTLEHLHLVIQAAMGWSDTHLHAFRRGDVVWAPPGFHDDIRHRSTRGVPLSSVLHRPGDRLSYMYDFGDSWGHDVTLEELTDEPCPRPRCIAGRRACPPEDCGGVHGYEDLLMALADPAHESHAESRAWAGPGYDPQWFDAEETDAALRSLG